MERDAFLFEYLAKQKAPFSWLDVGAGDGRVSRRIRERFGGDTFTCIDIAPCHDDVGAFDGKSLCWLDRSFDFVLFNFVLHHAAEHARNLLIDAAQVARRAVVIQEDIDDGTEEIRARLKAHDPNAVYYSLDGWLALFEELDLSASYRMFPTQVLEGGHSKYQVPRALFIIDTL